MKLAIGLNRKLVVRFLKKYMIIVILIGVIGGLGSVFSSLKSQGVQYVSAGHLVQNDNNYNLVTSYKQFVESSRFKTIINEKVNESAWKSTSYRDNYKVTLSPEGSTSPFFTITVVSDNPKYSKYLANEAMRLFITNIGKYLSGANTSIMSQASTSKTIDFRSSMGKTASIGVVAGLIFAVVITGIHLVWIGKIKDDKYISDMYEVKHLATISLHKINK
ncbi:hypothetical protein ACFP1L_04595 [Lactiplantibacillus nangangensis]|uniref:Capsular polysaccharide biosynthesis protein CpsC n=1 Tax=Lactiplantibacillus nangangensis TaxID=2559917 RepID=A0ABW1SI46_9LACO|nr:hypothetical protein [Lactiplantibacillus nangangensis]